jgi:hypothetical protein
MCEEKHGTVSTAIDKTVNILGEVFAGLLTLVGVVIVISFIGRIDHKQDGITGPKLPHPMNICIWKIHLSDPECFEKVQNILTKIVKGERP